MAIGALKSLMTTLRASAFLTGVTVLFGEETLYETDQPMPFISIVPIGGPWLAPGYAYAEDPNVELSWETPERIDVYIYAASTAANAQPIDHADAVETLRQKVLSAFQDQRGGLASDGSPAIGLQYKATDGRWELSKGELSRYGRCYVLQFVAMITVPMTAPVEATVTSVSITTTISEGV